MATTLGQLTIDQLLQEVQDAVNANDVNRTTDAMTEVQNRMQTDPNMINALSNINFSQPAATTTTATATGTGTGIAGGLGTSKIVQKYRVEEPPLYDGTPATLQNFKF